MKALKMTLGTLLLLALSGCEDPAKRVKSDPNDNAPRQTHEQGTIDTH